MPRYMQSFATSGTEQEAITQGLLAKPYVAVILDENRIDWGNEEPEPDYSKMPLTFEIISGGTIRWFQGSDSSSYPARTIQFKKNDEEWSSITANYYAQRIITVNAGDIVQFKGNNNKYADGLGINNPYGSCFRGTCLFKLYGNIMSLVNSENYTTMTSLPSGTSYNFAGMFWKCSGLTEVTNIVLPTGTNEFCFAKLFSDCTRLDKVKCLFSGTSRTGAFSLWMNNVASSGTFIKNPNMTWPTGADGIPTNWTVVDA